jgi:transcriptional regulator with XRE-family HTH domain
LTPRIESSATGERAESRKTHRPNAHDAQLAYEQELLTGEAADLVAALLDSAGLTQRELADRLGVSEARASRILSGSGNLTLQSLASIGWALGIRFRLVPTKVEERHHTPAANDPAPKWLQSLQSAVLRRTGETKGSVVAKRSSRGRRG